MKDGYEATATQRAPETDGFTNRKLIRPSLSKIEFRRPELVSPPPPKAGEEAVSAEPQTQSPQPPPSERRRERPERRRPMSVPEGTNAESFYYQKQMQTRTPIVVVLVDGEEIQGIIDWYDKGCIKLSRGSSNMLVYKANIRYIYKASDNPRR